MPENLQSHYPRQKRRIHKYAFPERDLVGHRLGLSKLQCAQFLRCRRPFLGKIDFNVGDGQLRLIYDQLGPAFRAIGESDLPWPFARTSVLDAVVEERVTD